MYATTGRQVGAVMLGEEMIRGVPKMALVVAANGRAAGLTRSQVRRPGGSGVASCSSTSSTIIVTASAR